MDDSDGGAPSDGGVSSADRTVEVDLSLYVTSVVIGEDSSRSGVKLLEHAPIPTGVRLVVSVPEGQAGDLLVEVTCGDYFA